MKSAARWSSMYE